MDKNGSADHRIYNPRGCEVNAVLHCNFRCRSCSHLSPIMPPWFADPQRVFLDLSRLARHYHCEFVKILGGEPLLHPRLPEIIHAARESSVAQRIVLCTNGSLLDSSASEVWSAVDEIEISVYPGKAISNDELDSYRRRARDHGTDLRVRLSPEFRESYSESGTDDGNLIDRIFRTCQIAHVWRCHTVHEGYFYRCPQSYFIHRLRHANPEDSGDGLKIRDDDFADDLRRHIDSAMGPAACRWCLGSVGRRFAHEQVSRRRWAELAKEPTEALLDRQLLAELEDDINEERHGKIKVENGPIPDSWTKS
ncbi:radical SAM protein [Streptomyces ureilyticus]|uniref:Radical SAM protein n=1 Tax=Streptomyces ureilyticus TaxID=1775131 RepID=A0ABX0DHV1_9ACTN|nr:radical SAM protein [Streptomyces ureilyticus]NGO41436.1 radical SAM protein [Streptomyces ureilyticus]